MNLTHLPHSPGVYLMRDRQSVILYIGKAKDLRKRVSSYFRQHDFTPKLISLLPLIQQIDYIPTDSERECLILEQKLIHRFQPLYNTMWRDDKSYPYIQLTLGEDYPRLFITRKKKRDGSLYFGPYPNVKFVKNLLKTLWRKKIFSLRPCRFVFEENEIISPGGLASSHSSLYQKVKSCIYLHTEQCPAPCVGRISKQDYREIAQKAGLFFKGKHEPLRTQLEQEMLTESKKLNYEKAALVRDQLSALSHLSERVALKKADEEFLVGQMRASRALTELKVSLSLPVPPLRIEGFDISNIQSVEPVGSLVVFEKGRPLKSEYKKFKVKTVRGPNDFAMIKEVVFRRYKRLLAEKKSLPDLILIDGGKGQLHAALEAIETLKAMDSEAASGLCAVPVISLAKQYEEVFVAGRSQPVRLSHDSPALHILQSVRDEAHRFAVTFHRARRAQTLRQDVPQARSPE